MKRFEVIESKRYRNTESGRLVSPYGACPWTSPHQKQFWVLELAGWTIRDNNLNQVGCGRVPWKTREEAEAMADKWNAEWEARRVA